MSDSLDDFQKARADLNEENLNCVHLGIKRFIALYHQAYESGPHGTKTKLRHLLYFVVAQNADFQAAAAQVRDAARLALGSHRSKHSFAPEPRFFGPANHLQVDA